MTKLSSVLTSLHARSDAIEAESATAKKLKEADAYKNLRANLSAFIVQSGTGNFATEPSYTERFPFWVTADVGVAVGLFSKPEGEIHPGASLAFGLSFYLAAVDKAEPLGITQWTARDWGRRFSL
ncbi:MAG: hypothetical protein ABW061_06165, partial [Polyangiaceae bacterium]